MRGWFWWHVGTRDAMRWYFTIGLIVGLLPAALPEKANPCSSCTASFQDHAVYGPARRFRDCFIANELPNERLGATGLVYTAIGTTHVQIASKSAVSLRVHSNSIHAAVLTNSVGQGKLLQSPGLFTRVLNVEGRCTADEPYVRNTLSQRREFMGTLESRKMEATGQRFAARVQKGSASERALHIFRTVKILSFHVGLKLYSEAMLFVDSDTLFCSPLHPIFDSFLRNAALRDKTQSGNGFIAFTKALKWHSITELQWLGDQSVEASIGENGLINLRRTVEPNTGMVLVRDGHVVQAVLSEWFDGIFMQKVRASNSSAASSDDEANSSDDGEETDSAVGEDSEAATGGTGMVKALFQAGMDQPALRLAIWNTSADVQILPRQYNCRGRNRKAVMKHGNVPMACGRAPVGSSQPCRIVHAHELTHLRKDEAWPTGGLANFYQVLRDHEALPSWPATVEAQQDLISTIRRQYSSTQAIFVHIPKRFEQP